MALSVVMPALEMAQDAGKLLAWRKREGERVTKGEPLLEVETDKAVVEIESPGDGILVGVTAAAGDIVPVGKTIAWLVLPGETAPADDVPGSHGSQGSQGSQGSRGSAGANLANQENLANPENLENPANLRMSPKARRLARERGADILSVRGSGPGGEILAEDILKLAGSRAAADLDSNAANPATLENLETPANLTLGSIGRLMAERALQSWTTVPHFFLVREVDAGALVATREKLGVAIERARGVALTLTDLLVALVARVLPKHPRMNASWTGEGIRLNRDANVGIAVAVDAGVVVTVIRRADTANIGDIALQRRDMTERARTGRLQPSDIAGATFTITNLGMYHVDAFTAIVVPPQAGILAVGAIADRVVPVDGQPAVRPMMTLTLSCDHRVIDGARGATFLNDVVEAIREPEKWLGL